MQTKSAPKIWKQFACVSAVEVNHKMNTAVRFFNARYNYFFDDNPNFITVMPLIRKRLLELDIFRILNMKNASIPWGMFTN